MLATPPSTPNDSVPPAGPFPGPPAPAPAAGGFRTVPVSALVAAGAVAAVLLVAGLVFLTRTGTANPDRSRRSLGPDKNSGIPPYAINNPPIVSAEEAGLRDNEEVIGVSLGGRHRAYRSMAFGGSPLKHVVNDRLGDQPVSVTYCDRTRCTKVIRRPREDSPRVVFGGLFHGDLLVRVGDDFYFQSDLTPTRPGFRKFPYQELKYEKTTWRKWRQAHPDTDAYAGVDPTVNLFR